MNLTQTKRAGNYDDPAWKLKLALVALNEMMAADMFDICVVRDAAGVLGVNVRSSEVFEQLRLLHCMPWKGMDPEIRAAIPHMIVTVLGQQAGRFEFTPPGSGSPVQTADAVVLRDGPKDPPKSKAPLLRRVMAHIAPTKSTEATQ